MNKFSGRKTAILAVSVIAAVVVIAVIFSNKATNQFFVNAKAQDFMKDIKPQEVNVSGAVSENFINSAQNFSINLFKKSIKSSTNTLVSPTSAYLALGMTANGAKGKTLDSFINVLGKYNLTIDDLNKAYKAYTDELTQKRGSTVMNISNSIWYRTGFKANRNFLQNNADFFGAGARTADFKDSKTKDYINNWVKNATNNKIDSIVDKINRDDVMYLINTLYFNAKWEMPFDASGTRDGKFYSEDGNTTTASFMNLEGKLDYIKGDNEDAVLLPYDDGRFAFLCILPKEGTTLKDYVNSIGENTIPDLISKKGKTYIGLSIPKFKVTAGVDLNDTLKNMGLESAFDKTADFSGMGASGQKLYISSVKQKTFLKVDELGTEAAAVTSVTMAKESVCIKHIINFNRPFIYAVIDTKTDLPLFIGSIASPKQ